MSKTAFALGLCLMAGSAMAQTPPAPAAGSGGGGAVGTSQTTPTRPGGTPPGTPTANGAPDQISRDTAGQQVIGHTTTPPGPIPGNTGAPGTGTR